MFKSLNRLTKTRNREFAAVFLRDRKNSVINNNMGFSCLRIGHITKNCRQKLTCNICRRGHPSSLHEERPQGENPVMPPHEESTSTVVCGVRVKNSDPTLKIVLVWLLCNRKQLRDLSVCTSGHYGHSKQQLIKTFVRKLMQKQNRIS